MRAQSSAQLDEWLERITSELAAFPGAAPFAVNLIVHRTNNRLEEDLAVGHCLRRQGLGVRRHGLRIGRLPGAGLGEWRWLGEWVRRGGVGCRPTCSGGLRYPGQRRQRTGPLLHARSPHGAGLLLHARGRRGAGLRCAEWLAERLPAGLLGAEWLSARLLRDPGDAARLGCGARQTAGVGCARYPAGIGRAAWTTTWAAG